MIPQITEALAKLESSEANKFQWTPKQWNGTHGYTIRTVFSKGFCYVFTHEYRLVAHP